MRERANQEEDDKGAQDGKATGNPERASVTSVSVRATKVVDYRWKGWSKVSESYVTYGYNETLRPGANEGTNLAEGSGQAVELSTHSGWARLSSQQSQAIAGSQFAEAEEDTVKDSKGCDVRCKLNVEATHDKSNNRLTKKTKNLLRMCR